MGQDVVGATDRKGREALTRRVYKLLHENSGRKAEWKINVGEARFILASRESRETEMKMEENGRGGNESTSLGCV